MTGVIPFLVPERMIESCKVVLTFEAVEKKSCGVPHSNETSSGVLSHGTIYLVRGFNF